MTGLSNMFHAHFSKFSRLGTCVSVCVWEGTCVRVYVCVCVTLSVCVCDIVRACVRACVRA